MRRSRPATAPLIALVVGLAAAAGATACSSSSTSSSSKFDSVASAIGGDGPVGAGTSTIPRSSTTTSSTGGDVAIGVDASGETLCALLADEDFANVGVAGVTAPTVNSDGPGSAYCVYAGRSAATGGVEMDVFVSADPAEAATTYQTAKGEYPATSPTRPDLPGIDEGELDAGGPDRAATIIVRRGDLVFTIGFPAGDQSRDQLLELARTVLSRAA